ncbi:MAG: VIT domain-containing protein [Bacteroidota bacterium]|nr:VIT domain-containing protein [Bacteroidota bacterium]
MKKRALIYLLSLFTFLSLSENLFAIGRVYARYPNNEHSPIFNLRIKTLTASITIQDQLAVTHVDQIFANDNNSRLEGFYIFKLPEGAQVNELYLWINGQRVPYTVKKKEEAVVIYKDIVQKLTDPAILQQLGNNVFKLQIFPFEPQNTRRIEIVYTQPMVYTKGSIQYTFPLDMNDYTSSPIENVSMTFDIRSHLPISGIETSVDQFPTAAQTTKIDSSHYTVVYGVENVAFSKDFFVRAGIPASIPAMTALTYSDPKVPNDKPYFLLWATTPDTLVGDTTKPRQVTFVADISSSMEGLRISQLKDVLNSFVDLLTEKDQFNIVVFSTGVAQFRPNLVAMTSTTRDSAKLFINNLSALGLTNIESALKKAFEQAYKDSLRTSILFLTDGQPSWGETNTDSIVARVQRWNSKNISLYTVGIGNDLDHTMLVKLAKQNFADYTRIYTEDSIYVKIKELYRKTILPPLKQLSMNFGTFDAFDVHPTPLPLMYASDQLTLTGRFSAVGSFPISLQGMVDGTQFSIGNQVAFNKNDTTTIAIGRYWGAQKIKSLLALIESIGEVKELVDQVVELSIKFSVLSPYTAFLVVEPQLTPPPPGGSTSVQEEYPLPTEYILEQNFPNPFNPTTTIRYFIPQNQTFVSITIFDMLGRKVRTLIAQSSTKGMFEITWNGKDDAGNTVPSGVYMYRLQAGQVQKAKTMMLLK